MIGPSSMPGANRFFCGRLHRRPFHVWLMDHLGMHQELYRVVGELQIRKRWVESRARGRSIYTCRKPMTHWKATIKPQGFKWVTMVHDRDFSAPDLQASENIKNRNTPYWRGRVIKPTRNTEGVQIPTEAWELGHKYEFTRWEELNNGSD